MLGWRLDFFFLLFYLSLCVISVIFVIIDMVAFIIIDIIVIYHYHCYVSFLLSISRFLILFYLAYQLTPRKKV